MVTDRYRTRDGLADYGFSLERQSDGAWRAYIESAPSYGLRSGDQNLTHRLRDGSRWYVCWTGRFETETQARAVASRWADRTQRYIRTGKRFEEPD